MKEDMEVEVEGEEEEEGSGKLGIIPFTVDLTHWGYRSALLPCCVQCSCTCAHLIAQCSLSCHKLWGSTPHLGSGVRGQGLHVHSVSRRVVALQSLLFECMF